MHQIIITLCESPFLTFFCFSVLCISVCSIVETVIFRPINRFIRHRNIKAHGWPPPHCDADGDLREVEEKEDAQ